MKYVYLQDWQESYVDKFIDRYGVDAGVDMLVCFETFGSLGKAMIETVHRIKINQELKKVKGILK